MKDPRPAMISARPPERRSRVAKSWKTRTGSSELRTVTALVNRMLTWPAHRGENEGRGPTPTNRAGVLADAEDVQPDLLGELRLFDELAHTRGSGRRPVPRRVGCGFGEGVESKFHVDGRWSVVRVSHQARFGAPKVPCVWPVAPVTHHSPLVACRSALRSPPSDRCPARRVPLAARSTRTAEPLNG